MSNCPKQHPQKSDKREINSFVVSGLFPIFVGYIKEISNTLYVNKITNLICKLDHYDRLSCWKAK